MTRTADYDYVLPPELIAQEPVEPRDAARLLVAQGSTRVAHRRVCDLPDLLTPGDLLVFNRSRVIPARLLGRKASGGRIEVLLVHPVQDGWRCLVRGKVRTGTRIELDGVVATVTACHEDGARTLSFPPGCEVLALAERIGRIPLPPYIARPDRPDDRLRYQTVFADRPGSVAAPTAGLHFTPGLLQALAERGIASARVELAIGPGTFKPVDTERIEDFRIHAEHAVCPAETVEAIHACRHRGGRVIAVGTTTVRTLESAAAQPGGLAPWQGWTSLFLHPPARLMAVDGLLTNFHLPRSSLLMLVACLCGRERLLALYAEAVERGYRFYSYGDAMLLLEDRPHGQIDRS